MSKKAISYRELLSEVSAKIKADAQAAGEKFDVKKVGKAAGERWAAVKSGADPEFSQAAPGTASKPKPGHKGAPSKTRPGRKDFVTHKGDKFYNRDGHRQNFNADGVVGTPYSHYTRHPKTAQDVLDMVDLCQDCRAKIEAVMTKPKGKGKGKRGKTSKGGRKKRKGGTRKRKN
jgi:hypothetical protein